MNSLSARNTYVEDVFRIKFKKVHLVGFIVQFITMHSQYNIKSFWLCKGQDISELNQLAFQEGLVAR